MGRQTTDLHKTFISINLSDASSKSLIEFPCVSCFLVFKLACHVAVYPNTIQSQAGLTFCEGLIEWEPDFLLAWQGKEEEYQTL